MTGRITKIIVKEKGQFEEPSVSVEVTLDDKNPKGIALDKKVVLEYDKG